MNIITVIAALAAIGLFTLCYFTFCLGKVLFLLLCAIVSTLKYYRYTQKKFKLNLKFKHKIKIIKSIFDEYLEFYFLGFEPRL